MPKKSPQFVTELKIWLHKKTNRSLDYGIFFLIIVAILAFGSLTGALNNIGSFFGIDTDDQVVAVSDSTNFHSGDVNVSGGTAIVGSHVEGDIKIGVTNEVLEKILDTHAVEIRKWASDLARYEHQIVQLKRAIHRLDVQAKAGDEDAAAALETARSSGGVTDFLDVLESQADTLLGRIESEVEILENDTQDFIAVSLEISALAYLVGDLARAESSTRSILKVQPNELNAITILGQIQSVHGDFSAAELQFERLLKLATTDANRSVAYNNLGIIYMKRSELNRAKEVFNKSLAIEEQLGRRVGMASNYLSLGVLYQTQGDLKRAEQMQEKSLEIYQELGLQGGISTAYGNLGTIRQHRGDLEQAEQMYEKSLEIADKLGIKEDIARAYGNLGVIYSTRGDPDRAEEMHKKSLAIAEELGNKEGMADSYDNLGVIYQNRGDLDRAEEMHLRALAIDRELGSKNGIASAYANLGVNYMRLGDMDRADEMHKKSLEIFEEIGSKEGIATCFVNMGSVCKERGNEARAQEYYSRSRDLFAEIGMPHMVQKVQGFIDGLSDDADGVK